MLSVGYAIGATGKIHTEYSRPNVYVDGTKIDYTYADGKLTVKNVTENKTIAVNLTENARTVTISGDAGNVEVTGNTDLDATKEVTITLEAKDGYTITGVESNLGSVSGTSGSAWTVKVPAGSEEIKISVKT